MSSFPPDPTNPYEAPSTDARPPRGHRSGDRLASLGARLGGAIIDILVMLLVQLPIFFAAGLLEFETSDRMPSLSELFFEDYWATAIMTFLGAVVFVAINGYLLATRAQSVGKLAVGIKIVTLDGDNASLPRIFGQRFLPVHMLASLIPVAGGLFGLVDILFIFREDRRCIHDLIAGTKVVEA